MICLCTCHEPDDRPCNMPGGCRTVANPCRNGCVWNDTGHQRPAAYGVLCRRCFWRLRHTVLDLLAAHGWLGEQMVRLSSGWAEPVSGTRDYDPSWLGLHDLRVEVAEVLRSWAAELAEDRGQCLVIPSDQVQRTVTYVLPQLPFVCGRPWLGDFSDELGDMLKRVHGSCPWRREARSLPVPCESCGLQTLVLYGGDDWVTCRNFECADVAVPWWRYERFCRRLALEHGLTKEVAA